MNIGWNGAIRRLAIALLANRLAAARSLAVAVAVLAGLFAQPSAAEQADYSKFNHMTTGFPLDGRHLNVPCETCHMNGVFEGTPRKCELCHIQGNPRSAVYMPDTHVPINKPILTPLTSVSPAGASGSVIIHADDCNHCHTTNGFDKTTPFPHAEVQPTPSNNCATCHTGIYAIGKTPNHIVTMASCDACHSTLSFGGAYATYPLGHIPSAQACSLCHSAGFSMELTRMVHAGISGGCIQCHAADATATAPLVFTMTFGTSNKQPVTLTPTSQNFHPPTSSMPTHFPIKESCNACHTTPTAPMLPTAAAGGFAGGVMSHVGITSGCANCHQDGSGPFIGVTTLVTMSSKGAHIPIPAGSACEKCHDPKSTSPGGFKITSTPQLSAAGHAVVSGEACSTCHGAGVSFGTVPNLVTQGTSPAHIPIPAGTACSACHAQNFVSGGFKITTSPVLSAANHTLVSSTCDTCHENNAADLAFQGLGTNIYLRPAAAANAGLSKPDALHATAGALSNTGDCGGCHNTTPPFQAKSLATAHIPLPNGQSTNCNTCHSAGYGPTLTKMMHSVVTSESCAACHGYGTGPFSGSGPGTGGQPVQPPGPVGSSGKHIPVGSADCVTCHASTDTESGTGFRLTGTPVLSAAGHAAVSSLSCASCHSSGMTWTLNGATLVVPPGTVGVSGPGNHMPLGTGDCKTCHTTATSFATGAFHISTAPSLSAAGHAAVASVRCDACHLSTDNTWATGVTTVAPSTVSPAHIPINGADCNACHTNATSFATGGFHITTSPVLNVAGHSAVAGVTCDTCHESSSINPATINWQGVLTNIYLRPGATKGLDLSSADAAHATGSLASPNDCANCHSTTPPFSNVTQLPSNHIKFASGSTVVCSTCHTVGFGAGQAVMSHSYAPVASETCATCHGSGTGPFSGTSPGTGGQPVQPPGAVGTSGSANHIPVGSADCKGCHATSDAMTGTGFHISAVPPMTAADHTAVVSSVTCATCHGSGKAWYGATTLKTPPGTPAVFPCTGAACNPSASNHIPIPSADGCNTCHANTNYTSFAGTAMNHAAISSSCSGCHNAGDAFYGVTIKTNTLSPAHIPVGATPACEGCHSASNFTAFGPGTAMTPTTHLQVPQTLETCETCHEGTPPAGPFYGVTIVLRPTTAKDANHPQTGDCGPSCHTTTPPFLGGAKPSGHIASSSTCSNCHTGTSPYTPAGTNMNHGDSGVGTAGSPVACASCHGYGAVAPDGHAFVGTAQGQAGGQPLQPGGTLNGPAGSSQHLHFNGAACSMCHTSTTVPGGFAGAKVPHTNGPFMTYTRGTGKTSGSGTSTPKCVTCHAPKGTTWQNAGGFSTETMGSHQGSTTTADCIDCHSATGGFAAAAAAAAKRPLAAAKKALGGPSGGTRPVVPGPSVRPLAGAAQLSGTGPFSHAGVAQGSCATCHRPGGSAPAMPGGHLPTTLSCDQCHSAFAWLPVRYAHTGVGPGHCASCHAAAGKWATPKPSNHFLTASSCDVCHHSTETWLPVMYDHLSPRYHPVTGFVQCIDCHTNNTQMVVPVSARQAPHSPLPGAIKR